MSFENSNIRQISTISKPMNFKQTLLSKYKKRLEKNLSFSSRDTIEELNPRESRIIPNHIKHPSQPINFIACNKENIPLKQKSLPRIKIPLGKIQNSFYSKLEILEQKLNLSNQHISIPQGFFSPAQSNRHSNLD
ncbi:unnamed protein product [Blepharisma stoltei]|uniref:Uncharacterized protein n=1 Tax=Blepharisma stoltei TaxID=1481888 RepID=A0AAU9JFG0_9CILI|nr:unnamed protein product [Blepharisma stoltei]